MDGMAMSLSQFGETGECDEGMSELVNFFYGRNNNHFYGSIIKEIVIPQIKEIVIPQIKEIVIPPIKEIVIPHDSLLWVK
jgi:hypothetical protein